jgi:hypothetical protein
MDGVFVPNLTYGAKVMPKGGFAASGLCVDVRPAGRAWIAAGNASRARVFSTSDFGRTWRAADAPVVAGEAAGLTSISMRDDHNGYAFGGNLGVTDRRTDNVAATSDGGRSWSALPTVSFDGAVYGGLHVPGRAPTLIAVGPAGFAVSSDGGATWSTADSRGWWSVGSAGPGATWLAGPEGRIARVTWFHTD